MPVRKLSPTDKINIRAPEALQLDIIRIIESNQSEYRNFSDFILGAMRKEVVYQQARIKGKARDYQIVPDRQEP